MTRGNGQLLDDQLRDDQLRAAISKLVIRAGFDVEDITVRLAGGRRLVRTVVDRDDGVDLDTAAALSRDIAAALDDEYDEALGEAAYTLEITSRGIGAPLTLPRHFRRAAGRLATIVRTDGDVLSARIALVDETTLTVLAGRNGLEPTSIALGDISSAKVEVEFSPRSAIVLAALTELGVPSRHQSPQDPVSDRQAVLDEKAASNREPVPNQESASNSGAPEIEGNDAR